MQLMELLQTAGGLAVLHLVQSILFSAMVYLLAAEYMRTLKADLVYKLIASFSITLLNIFSTALYYLNQFAGLPTSDEFFPLLHNVVFVIIILALARAFIYDFLGPRNQERFDLYFNLNMAAVIGGYFILQYFWLNSAHPEHGFKQSWIQLAFAMYFTIVLVILIIINLKYRKRFAARISIAFGAIIVVQIVNILYFFDPELPSQLLVLQAVAPVLIPAMFGSVVFKELIASNTRMLQDLKDSFETQKGVIHEMDSLCVELNRLSNNITHKAGSSWSRLLEMKQIAENDLARNVILEKIRHQSREIEETAGQAESLHTVIERIQSKNRDLASIAEKIGYVNQ